ncbi:hypothetical protein ZHAS_00015625 [Anopheles sinensis]|uniref:Uncharacterized protein n=1 Tax=Anopheles sinensis TaxID=74873 RepID=A0A084WAY6_ANOSI|nr:hypothetical protein ZHAS_00015625 [Anopheles sinensis]
MMTMMVLGCTERWWRDATGGVASYTSTVATPETFWTTTQPPRHPRREPSNGK